MTADVFRLCSAEGMPLDPKIQSTALAMYSRSPFSMRDIVRDVTSDRSDAFYEKWIVGFGHNSVAEHASIPICYEGVSIIASKALESMPRGAYSEKSTRFQKFNSSCFVTPAGVSDDFQNAARELYAAYHRTYPLLRERLEKETPNASPDAIHKQTCDNIRYLLPAGTGTNLAVGLNFRDARDLVCDLLGSSNQELVQLGERTRDILDKACAPLVRHIVPARSLPVRHLAIPYATLADRIGKANIEMQTFGAEAALDGFIRQVQLMYGLTEFETFMANRRPHEEVPKIFDMISVTFDITMDYGAYRDLQRHRKCTQFAELLTMNYGYDIPADIARFSDLRSDYEKTMAWIQRQLPADVETAQYLVPLGSLFKSRYMMTLRELYYIVEQRTQPQGHISYRSVAYKMFEMASAVFPPLMRWCRAVKPDTYDKLR